MTPEMRDALHAVGCAVSFVDGEVLRQKGTFAPDILLITKGQVDCVLSEDDAVHVSVGPGTIVGEIGFLTGQGATATLRALGPVEALSLDARALQLLRQQAPGIAAEVLRHLAQLLHKRATQNESLLADVDGTGPEEVEVVRCSTLDQKRTAQRVRYDVMCLEAEQDSSFADHDEGIIVDALDRLGTSFIAFTGVQAVGTMQVTLGPQEGEVARIFPQIGDAVQSDTAVLSAIALHAAHRDPDLYRQFFVAIRTFAEASGATSIIAMCPKEDETNFADLGFHNMALATDPDTIPMRLTLQANS